MSSLFTKIIRRELPAHIVAEDEHFIAILDKFPLTEGHTLVIPKAEVDDLFDQADSVLSGCLLFARGVARKIRRVVACKRVGVAVVGLEVPHAHLHLIPLQGVEDINFSRKKMVISPDRMQFLADKIKTA